MSWTHYVLCLLWPIKFYIELSPGPCTLFWLRRYILEEPFLCSRLRETEPCVICCVQFTMYCTEQKSIISIKNNRLKKSRPSPHRPCVLSWRSFGRNPDTQSNSTYPSSLFLDPWGLANLHPPLQPPLWNLSWTWSTYIWEKCQKMVSTDNRSCYAQCIPKQMFHLKCCIIQLIFDDTVSYCSQW